MPSLNISELIRIELQGKHEASARYDQIIWRIRSGYVVVIYGLLTFTIGEKMNFANVTLSHALFTAAISIVAIGIDWAMRVRQIRVLRYRDRLMDVAVDLTCGEEISPEYLKSSLHISGEDRLIPIETQDYIKMMPMLFFYTITVVLVLVAYLIN